MKISEVTITDLKEYANVEHDLDDSLFQTILAATKAYIEGYTGLTAEAMDTKEDLTIALMILSNEMYENRVYSVDNDKVNSIVSNLLGMYSMNLL